MTDISKQQTAKIYQFPAGGRAGLSIQNDASRGTSDPVQIKPHKIVLGGGCWYHEAAMKESDLNSAG